MGECWWDRVLEYEGQYLTKCGNWSNVCVCIKNSKLVLNEFAKRERKGAIEFNEQN